LLRLLPCVLRVVADPAEPSQDGLESIRLVHDLLRCVSPADGQEQLLGLVVPLLVHALAPPDAQDEAKAQRGGSCGDHGGVTAHGLPCRNMAVEQHGWRCHYHSLTSGDDEAEGGDTAGGSG